MAARLILTRGDGVETEIALSGGAVTIGSDPACDAVLPGDLVSGHHAGVRHEPGRWILTDEGSEFGTFVNGRRVAVQELRHGDRVELGIGGPVVRFEWESVDRKQGMADTQNNLRYPSELADDVPQSDGQPLEGGGIAVPVFAKRAGLVALAAALVAAAVLWLSGREGGTMTSGSDGSGSAGVGGTYYLDRESRALAADLARQRAEAARLDRGGEARSRRERELASLRGSLGAEAGTGGGLAERARSLETWLASADLLDTVFDEADESVVLLQTGFRVDGEYFPGPIGSGFVVAPGGRLVTSRRVVDPDRFVRSDADAGLACAVAATRAEGRSVQTVVSVWFSGSRVSRLPGGGLDPESADASTADGSLAIDGFAPSEGEGKTYPCSARGGSAVKSVYGGVDRSDVAVLSFSKGDRPALTLGRSPSSDALHLLAGYPRGALPEKTGALAGWAGISTARATENGFLLEVPFQPGTAGGPVLGPSGAVLGMASVSRDGGTLVLSASAIQAALETL